MWPFDKRSPAGGGRAPGGGSGADGEDGDDSDIRFDGVSLAELTRGLQHAAASANAVVAHQYTSMLDQFFDRNEAGQLVAKVVVLETPDGQRLNLPLITLMTPRGIALERMRIELAVRADDVSAIDQNHHFDSGMHRCGEFTVSMTPRSAGSKTDDRERNAMDIAIEFVTTDPPEGLMRLIDEYTNAIVPQRAGE